VRANKWREFEHISWDDKKEKRYIREIIYGKKRLIRYWEITKDKEQVPPESTWLVMTRIPNLKCKDVGKIYQIRGWIEYGFKQSKYELGWADFRVTKYADIAKWWELVMSAYLLISLHSENFNPSLASVPDNLQKHERWDHGKGWKNILNNVRLVMQPSICFNLILRWLKVFPIPQLSLGFPRLISLMEQFDCLRYLVELWDEFCYSSA
jgi:hypothetical protein